MKPPFDKYRPGDFPSADLENQKAEEIFRLTQGSGGASGVEGKSSFHSPDTKFWAMLLGKTYQGGGLPDYYSFAILWEDALYADDNPPTLHFAADQSAFAGIVKRVGINSSFPAYEVNGVTATVSSKSSILTPAAVITGTASSGGLIEITTGAAHGLTTGDVVIIWGVQGTDEANGQWTITTVDGTHFTLNGSTWINAWTSGGDWATFDGAIVLMWPGEGGEYFCFSASAGATPPPPATDLSVLSLLATWSQSFTANTPANVNFNVAAQCGTDVTWSSPSTILLTAGKLYRYDAVVPIHDSGLSEGDNVDLFIVSSGSTDWDVRHLVNDANSTSSLHNNKVAALRLSGIIWGVASVTLHLISSSSFTLTNDYPSQFTVQEICTTLTTVTITTTTTTTSTTSSTTSTTTTTGTTTTTTTTSTTTSTTTTTTSACNLSVTAKGTNTAGSTNTVGIASVTCSTGDELLVAVARLSSSPNTNPGSCTWNSISMTESSQTPALDPGGNPSVAIEMFRLNVASGATGTITYTTPGSTTMLALAIVARTLTGSSNGTDTGMATFGTTSSSPDTGAAVTNHNCSMWWGVLAQYKAIGSIVTGSWAHSYTNGQTAAVGLISLNEGYQLVSAGGNQDAGKTGTTQDTFAIVAEAYF